jgi:hypothetical protein
MILKKPTKRLRTFSPSLSSGALHCVELSKSSFFLVQSYELQPFVSSLHLVSVKMNAATRALDLANEAQGLNQMFANWPNGMNHRYQGLLSRPCDNTMFDNILQSVNLNAPYFGKGNRVPMTEHNIHL